MLGTVAGLERAVGGDNVVGFAGLGSRLLWAAAVLTVSVLSLAGIPPFGGFVGKTMLLGAVLAAGWEWLALLIAANVAAALVYYLRLLEPLYLRTPLIVATIQEPPLLRLVLVLLALGSLLSGCYLSAGPRWPSWPARS